MDCALGAIDCAVLVISAVRGIQTQTLTHWAKLKSAGVPVAVFVNKVDSIGEKGEDILLDIEEFLGKKPLVFGLHSLNENNELGCLDILNQVKLKPDGKRAISLDEMEPHEEAQIEKYREEIIEALAEESEEVAEAWMSGNVLTPKKILPKLTRLFGNSDYIPVCFGSAKTQLGTRTLLNTLKNALPKVEKTIEPSDWLMVLKARWNSKKGCVFLVRCLSVSPSGPLPTGLELFVPHGQDLEIIGSQAIGDLYILSSENNQYKMGDVIGFEGQVNHAGVQQEYPSLLESSLEAKDAESLEKIGHALELVKQTDPSYKIDFDESLGVWWVRAMGEVHLEVLLSRLQDEFEVEANFAAPKVQKKQGLINKMPISGSLQMGDDILEISGEFYPVEKGFEFENKIDSDVPPFVDAVVNSVLRTLCESGLSNQGNLEGLGFRLDKIKSEGRLLPGQLQKLLMDQFKLNLSEKSFWTKEPQMQVHINLDDEYCGQVLNDLQAKNAQIEQVQKELHGTSIQAKLLLSESFGYTTDLRTLSKGQASFSMEFDSWKTV